MKFEYIRDVRGFFEVLDKCKGNVYLVTQEGDRLNLKSRLTQYVAFSALFNGNPIEGMELEFDNTEDENEVVHYLLEGDYTPEGER
jgi:hypothetical protein